MAEEPTKGEIELFYKCVSIVAVNIAQAARMPVDEDIVHTAKQILTGNHDGILGHHGEFIRLVFLEQHPQNLDLWRVVMVVNNADGKEDKPIYTELVLEEEEVPKVEPVGDTEGRAWLLFPANLKCDRHHEGVCPVCGTEGLKKALFGDQMMNTPVKMVIPLFVKSDGLVN